MINCKIFRKEYIIVLLILISFVSNTFSQSLPKKDKDAILNTLNTQSDAWNKGDLNSFMHGYWESDSLKFIGKNGITYGYQNTLDRYKKGYPDKAAMGILSFTILKVDALGKKHALVVGKWHLEREAGNLEGHFTLTWRKLKGKWVIIVDHSS